MTNFGKYDIPIFEDDLTTIKEYFRIALNTIFFHRWLGQTNYVDTKSIFNNITYIKIPNETFQKAIDSTLSQLEKNIHRSKGCLIQVNFYQKKVNKFYIIQELENLWESWRFLFVLNPHSEMLALQKESKIREFLSFILAKLNDKYDFMPDFDPEDTSLPEETFPYEIIINSNLSDKDFMTYPKEFNC